MEIRIARLESDMEHVKKTLDRMDSGLESIRADTGVLKIGVATLTERVSHLPSKGFIFSVAAAMVATVGLATGLIVRFFPG